MGNDVTRVSLRHGLTKRIQQNIVLCTYAPTWELPGIVVEMPLDKEKSYQ